VDNEITEVHEEKPREHTRLLLPMIRSLLDDAGLQPKDLDAIILGNGPGSFIGMRIAASVAQGLAFGAGLKIMPVSSLAAVATQVFAENNASEVVVAQDAHMREVYLGIYRRDADGLPYEFVSERLQGPAPIVELDSALDGSRVVAGYGWQRYPELLAANQGHIADASDVLHPRATHLLPLGAVGLANGLAVAPKDVVPAYLRQKVAEKSTRAP
jgi:tRNA threonylcarbamoyladenosine biosynthesis protein TsaB